ncbi:MAG: glutathione S-transferase family protein [Pseudomonadota bacterium]
MVQLLEQDIATKEVLDWKGLHLLHFMGSSCSQKTRIFLSLKGVVWESHHVDLSQRENYSDWFMGINPRGLVPVLVDNGKVIIESNDILEYLETKFPEPQLIPDGKNTEAKALLDEEDELHLDLRAISMRYMFGDKRAMRSADELEKFNAAGTGTVGGEVDPEKDVQFKFFKDMIENDGITDQQIVQAVSRFEASFDKLEQHLTDQPYLMGDAISLVDIAWYIYAFRLTLAGYPLNDSHPKLGAWYDGLHAREEFSREVAMPPPLMQMIEGMQAEQKASGQSLQQLIDRAA